MLSTRGIENEYMFIDAKTFVPFNFLNTDTSSHRANALFLKFLERYSFRSQIDNLVDLKPELDACQLEISSAPKDVSLSPENIIEKMAQAYEYLLYCLEAFNHHYQTNIILSTRAVPVTDDYEPMPSDNERYNEIHKRIYELEEQHGVAKNTLRRSTNVLGIHTHIGFNSPVLALKVIRAILEDSFPRNEYFAKYFAQLVSTVRIEKIQLLVSALGQSLRPDETLNPKTYDFSKDNYGIFRVKKYEENQFTLENRSLDFGIEKLTYSPTQLYDYNLYCLKKSEEYYRNLIDQYSL